MNRLILLPLLLGFAGCAGMPMSHEHGAESTAHHVALQPDQLQWSAAPPGLPPGSTMAVLVGDPGKPGMFTLRAKLPAGYKVPPHWHTFAENITVLSGALYIGASDSLDKSNATRLPVGGYAMLPGKMHHFALCDEDTVIQVHGMGPFDITYINPADDPRKIAPSNGH